MAKPSAAAQGRVRSSPRPTQLAGWRGSLHTSWIEIVIALLVASVGISMALPTVQTAVLSAVAPHKMGKASGINYMAQRFGAVFAIAIGSSVFASYGGLGTAATVTAGFKPALWTCAVFAGLGALAATAMSVQWPRRSRAFWRPVIRSGG